MISPERFLDFLEEQDINFFAGVPDSLLQSFCIALFGRYGSANAHHMVAVNEGNAVALGAGYHLATGNTPLVYLQNSGLGNAVNPATGLTDPAVYGIPVVYLVGWRGEPGVHDEPQHVKQGWITCDLLDILDIPYLILDKKTTWEELSATFNGSFKHALHEGKSVALVVRKGAFEAPRNDFPAVQATMSRESVIAKLSDALGGDDYIVSTTGKISRELFEHRRQSNNPHRGHEFLTVGSMGHASAIALTVSLNHPEKRVWCLDGDGAVLMHMGSLATIGQANPSNLVHVILNNGSHESVGGMPTVAHEIDLCQIARACGYPQVARIETETQLANLLQQISERPMLTFIEIKVSSGSRADLIRPDTTPRDNKRAFMESLQRNQ